MSVAQGRRLIPGHRIDMGWNWTCCQNFKLNMFSTVPERVEDGHTKLLHDATAFADANSSNIGAAAGR